MEGEVRRGRNGTGNGKRGGRWERGGQQGLEAKRRPLVRNTSEYQESYEWRGADYIRHLQHPERAQRGIGVGTVGGGPGQHGPGHLPEDQVH